MTKMFAWGVELLYNKYIMEQFFAQNGDIILKLILAIFLGTLVGAERFLVHKEAGLKTHALVSMGSALFVIISEFLVQKYSGLNGFNPVMIPSNIIVGIGFLGAGTIVLSGARLKGLTTAGGLWVTAGIGMAAGFGFSSLAIISTVLVLLILIFVNILEKPLLKISEENIHQNQEN
jgi:putative Mg2+ transporter-C (MgtC) family protein